MPSVANCTQCQRIFQRVHSPMCPECHQEYMSKFSNVYRYVQEHPHLTLEDIATHCDIPVRDVEALFFQGKLGTASNHVIYHCQRCNRPMAPAMRKGRFCVSCAGQFENEAGLIESEKELLEKRPKTGGKTMKSGHEATMPLMKETTEKIILTSDAKEPADSTGDSYGFNRLQSCGD